MTLVEAVVAAAVVMTVVVAATGACLTARATAGAGQGRAGADACLAARIEELRALPYDEPAGSGVGAPADLLSAVFPHADQSRDTAAAFFAPDARDGCAPGTFFTVRAAGGEPVTVAATFVVSTAGGFRPLDPALLAGYDHTDGGVAPAAALLLRVSVAWRGGGRAGTVRRTVVAADRPASLCPVAFPSPS